MMNDREEFYQEILKTLSKYKNAKEGIVITGHWDALTGTQSITFYKNPDNTFKMKIQSVEGLIFALDDYCSFEEMVFELKNFIDKNFSQLYCRNFLSFFSVIEF